MNVIVQGQLINIFKTADLQIKKLVKLRGEK